MNRSRFLGPAALLLLAASFPAAALEPREVRFDVFAFSQEDAGGQAFKAEGIRYFGARGSVRAEVSRTVGFHTAAALAVISNDDPAELPASVGRERITSASARVLALDLAATFEIRAPGSPWTLRPGLYYHQQKGYLSEGFDVGVDREFSGGDTIVSAAFKVRLAFVDLRYWDSRNDGRDLSSSNTFALGLRQNVSPSVVLTLGAQYVRQDGILSDTYNYVLLYGPDGVPYSVRDEVLPGERHRGQVSARLRWSPRLGTALGLDGSVYFDDWGIGHRAVEPSVAWPLPGGGDARVWYRFSDQDAAKHFDARPRFAARYRTQDSDLGGFRMHGGGVTAGFPFRTAAGAWEWRGSLFGFDRGDGVRAVALDAGVVRKW